MKRRIAVDVDDVLAGFHTSLIKWHNQKYGTNLQVCDLKSYFFNEVWGGTLEQAIEKVKEFNYSPYFKEILPIEDSIISIDCLGKDNDLFIVTSRPLFIQEETNRWMDSFFKDKFQDILYASNHYSGAVNSNKTKLQICNALGVSVLIDDSLDYIKKCAGTQVNGLLFGDYPWNQNGNLPEGTLRVRNWKEVLEVLI